MNEIKTQSPSYVTVTLVRDGDRQTLEIPPGFELAATKVTICKQGDKLTIQPEQPGTLTLKQLLDSWEPLTEEEWPDIDDSDLGPLRDVVL